MGGVCHQGRAGRLGPATSAVCLYNKVGLGLFFRRATLDQTLCWGDERGTHPAPVLPWLPSCHADASSPPRLSVPCPQ